jgi:hypothetical protein
MQKHWFICSPPYEDKREQNPAGTPIRHGTVTGYQGGMMSQRRGKLLLDKRRGKKVGSHFRTIRERGCEGADSDRD